MPLINILSIPVAMILGFILKVMADPDEPDCPGIFLLLSLTAIGFALGGATKLVNDMGFYNHVGGITLSMSALSMLGFGLTCWSIGRRKAAHEAREFWLEKIRESKDLHPAP